MSTLLNSLDYKNCYRLAYSQLVTATPETEMRLHATTDI